MGSAFTRNERCHVTHCNVYPRRDCPAILVLLTSIALAEEIFTHNSNQVLCELHLEYDVRMVAQNLGRRSRVLRNNFRAFIFGVYMKIHILGLIGSNQVIFRQNMYNISGIKSWKFAKK